MIVKKKEGQLLLTIRSQAGGHFLNRLTGDNWRVWAVLKRYLKAILTNTCSDTITIMS